MNTVAGIGKAHRFRDAVLLAAGVDRFELLSQFGQRFLGDAHVIARVIADLEAVVVQFGDLLPTEVVALVRRK